MRPIWSGHISFGLISIPVSLSSAIEASERVSFRLLHRKDRAPIEYKKFCSKEEVEVPNDEIVRGYEAAKGQFALVENEDLDRVGEEAVGEDGGAIQVLQFVPAGSVDPISFDHPYYAWPRKGGERAYGVLLSALADTGRLGVARIPLRGRPRLCCLIPHPDAIALQTLRPFEELRDPKDLVKGARAAGAGEVKMAKLLIEQLSTEGWEPSEHPDVYRKALQKLLSSRARFQLKKPAAEGSGAEVVDLMAALKKSLHKARARPRKAAARRGAA